MAYAICLGYRSISVGTHQALTWHADKTKKLFAFASCSYLSCWGMFKPHMCNDPNKVAIQKQIAHLQRTGHSRHPFLRVQHPGYATEKKTRQWNSILNQTVPNISPEHTASWSPHPNKGQSLGHMASLLKDNNGRTFLRQGCHLRKIGKGMLTSIKTHFLGTTNLFALTSQEQNALYEKKIWYKIFRTV